MLISVSQWLRSLLRDGESLEVNPLECCFRSMLRVIVLLEAEPPSQSQISWRLKQVSLKNFPVFSAIHHSFNSDQFPNPRQWKNIPTAFGGRPSFGRFVVVPYSFHFFNGFNGALWDIQSFIYFFITQPWSVHLHNFVPACLVVLQTLGPFRTFNCVTSEGNWLHQILFKDFIAKGVNTYARTTFPCLFF